VKKKTKGIIMFLFFGGIMVSSGMVIGIPGILPTDQEDTITITGTPMDNVPDSQRPQFCESGDAKSNAYITEYKIPTKCTQPLAITADPSGNIWFAQVNTGNLAKFSPISGTFTEYENPQWPPQTRSMMWGIDYSPDGSIWYTDEANDFIWKFSIQDENFAGAGYPSEGESLPQRLQIIGSKIFVNDFTGNQITILDPASQIGESREYLSIPSPVENSVTGAFSVKDFRDFPFFIEQTNCSVSAYASFNPRDFNLSPYFLKIFCNA